MFRFAMMLFAGSLLALAVGQHHVLASEADPLPSWNKGAAKASIVNFVKNTTAKGGRDYVEPGQRVATFDQDGTLWVEHPVYSQVMFILDRVADLAKDKPNLKKVEPYKTVLSGDHEAIAKLSAHDMEVLEQFR